MKQENPLKLTLQQIGRLGGLSRSAKKKRAVKKNGKLGGRPKKNEN